MNSFAVLVIFLMLLPKIHSQDEQNFEEDSKKPFSLPPSFLSSHCNLKSYSSIGHTTACIRWFRLAVDHCEDMLRIGRFQLLELFPSPEQTNENGVSFEINPNALSILDCKNLFISISKDYVLREPYYELQAYSMRILLTTIWIVAAIVTAGLLTTFAYRVYRVQKQQS